jgi:hypothetical protein
LPSQKQTRLHAAEPWPEIIRIIEARSVYEAIETAFAIERCEPPKGR